MQILRVRRGFQADHSSSSYLFYAADKPVSERGRQVAQRYSSRADIGKRSVRYQKWGESSLSFGAYKALLGEHYDVMASESYDWWTFVIAVPRNAKTNLLPARFEDARGYDDLGVDIEKYGSRWAINIFCSLDYGCVELDRHDEDLLEHLVDLLVDIREEILAGNFSFLSAVAGFYGGFESEDAGEEDQDTAPVWEDPALTKAELQQECERRHVSFRKSWNKSQLREALKQAFGQGELSPSAEQLVGYLSQH